MIQTDRYQILFKLALILFLGVEKWFLGAMFWNVSEMIRSILELRAAEVNLNSLIGCYKIRFDAYGVLAMRDLACI